MKRYFRWGLDATGKPLRKTTCVGYKLVDLDVACNSIIVVVVVVMMMMMRLNPTSSTR